MDSKRHEGHGPSMQDDESMERPYRSEVDGSMLGTEPTNVARERKVRQLRVVVLVAFAAAAVAAGALIASNFGSQGQPQSGSPSQAPAAAPATPTSTPTASATAVPTVSATVPAAATPELAWSSHVSAGAHAQFDLPTGWTATDVPAGTASNPASGIQVTDETGRVVAKFYHGAGGGVGGACGPGTYKQTELDKAATSLTGQWVTASQARFSYRVLDQTAEGKGISYQIGLADKSSGEVRDSCLMYSFVAGAPQGTLSFATSDAQGPDSNTFSTMEEAKQYLQAPEYQKLKRMITSLQLTQ